MGTFETCPLSFYFSRVAKIPEPATVDTVVGHFVHGVLERLLELPVGERTLEQARTIASQMRSELTDDPEFMSLDLSEDEERDWVWRCWKSIVAYFQIEDPALVNVKSVEQHLYAEVWGVPLRGISDRVETDVEGRIVVSDYKSGSTPSPGWGNRRLRQLALYGLLIEAVTGDRAHTLQLLFINDTDPCRIVGRYTEKIETEVGEALAGVWTSVRESMSQAQFVATPSVLCGWCTHRPYCPAWGGQLSDAPHPGVANVQIRLPL